MLRRALIVVLALLSLPAALVACKDRRAAHDDAAAPASTSASASASTSASASDAPAASADAGPKKPLELLQFRITSGIQNKNPKDTLTSAVPGQRVWVHLTLRNRSAETRTVKLAFRVNGDERTAVTLDVEPSWSFRTWGYNTLRDFDSGELAIEVTDDSGATLVTDKLPIRPVKAVKDAAK